MSGPTAGHLAIAAEPSDDGARCRFRVDRPVDPGRWTYVADREAAAGSPLAERLFAIQGVESVLISHDAVTITRRGGRDVPLIGPYVRLVRRALGDRSASAVDWKTLGRAVGAAIRAQLASGEPPVSDALRAAMPTSEELRNRVVRVLDDQVNPVVADHGGGVELVDLVDNVAYLRLRGGCQGCGLADLTLRHGVEVALRESVPELGEIFDLTDHAGGPAPYVPRGGATRGNASPFAPTRGRRRPAGHE